MKIRLLAYLPFAVASLGQLAHAQGWVSLGTPGPDIHNLIVDPTDPDHLVATTANEANETFDAGATWNAVVGPTPGSPLFQQLRFGSEGELMLFSHGAGPNPPAFGQRVLVRNGTSWQPFGPTVTGSSFEVVGHVTRGKANPDLMAVDTYEPFDFGRGWVYLSDDGGTTWTTSGPSGPAGPGLYIAESPTGPYIVRIVNLSDKLGPRFAILRSNGWSAPDQPLLLPPDGDLFHGFDPTHPESMWAITHDASATGPSPVLRSVDGGSTFHPTNGLTWARTLLTHPLRPDWLLRADPWEIAETTDGGASWSQLAPLPSGVNFVRNLVSSEDGRYLYMWYFNWPTIYRLDMNPFQGVQECSAELNASGERGRIRALGSMSIQSNAIDLVADRVPTGQFGFFLTSQTAGFTANPAGSFGNLCLDGSIGRYLDLIQNSGVHGTFEGRLDLTSMPVGVVPMPAGVGETWRFQAWFRDSQGAVQGSNFTDAIALTLTQ